MLRCDVRSRCALVALWCLLAPLAAQQPGWTRHDSFYASSMPSLVWDDQRALFVAYQGYSGMFRIDETWERRGGGWLRRPGTGSDFTIGGMVYDSWRHETILHGFHYAADRPRTMIYGAGHWTQHAGPVPSAVFDAALAFDSARGRVVLFGGRTGPTMFAETWEWDGQGWQQRTPVASPPARAYAAMAFDPVRARTVLFGGTGAAGQLSGTWEWDGTNWEQRWPSAEPPVRSRPVMVFDPRARAVLLAGGYYTSRRDDTWRWDGSNWQQLAASGFGGSSACTDGNDAFALCNPDGRLQLRRWNGAAWQLVQEISPLANLQPTAPGPAGGVFLWGGESATPESALWDGIAWRPVAAAGTAPPARNGHCMALDVARRRVVLFGGANANGQLTDTWEWDGQQWFLGAPASAGPVLWPVGRALVHDPARGRTVLVGGATLAGTFTGATWEWDGTRWRGVFTGQAPIDRSEPAAAFDWQGLRVVMFGGAHVNGFWLQDTWFYDGVAWTPGPAPPPTTLQRPTMAWEPARNRMMLFALPPASGPSVASLAFELNGGWQPALAPTSDPLTGSIAVHDLIRGRLVLLRNPGCVQELSPSVPAVDVLGGGCQASIAPRLDAIGQPLLGTTLWLDATGTGTGFALLVMASRAGNLTAGACTLVPALGEFAEFRPTPSGFATFALPVPRAAALQGLRVHAQVVGADAAAPLGLVASDALRLTVGS
jgi:hypothetical protein